MMVDFPPPIAFGLPAQFTEWRPDQVTAFQQITDSSSRFVGLTMPTGSGKTLTYMMAASVTTGRTVVLTGTKGLQDQVYAEFKDMGLLDIRGQQNYPCKALDGDGEYTHLHEHGEGVSMCDKGPCHVNLPCTLKEAGCDYYDKIRLAYGAEYVSTSYAFWLAQRRYSQGLGTVDLLVLDEAHEAFDELARALTIKLEKWLCHAVDLHPPQHGFTHLSEWREWGSYHANRLKAKLDQLPLSHSASDMKFRRRLKAAERILKAMAEMTPGNWVEDSNPDAWVFEVLNPAHAAEELLFQGAKKIVFLSATLTSKTLRLLGVKTDQRIQWECPSRFPVARRPVIYVPTVRVDGKWTKAAQTQWMGRIDNIVKARLDRKGIIHTVSYARAEKIKKESDYSDYMTIPRSPQTVVQVEAFKKNPTAGWLVSPSLTTGWDFPGDTCRVQIVAKLPFPDTRSKILQARAAIDDQYLPYLMTQALVQSVGRGMRSADDWCETLIIDDHFAWVRNKYKALFPKWFLEAVRESKTLPPPLVPPATSWALT